MGCTFSVEWSKNNATPKCRLPLQAVLDSKLVASAKSLACKCKNAANLPEMIDKNEEVNTRGDDEANANNADKYTKTHKKRKGPPENHSTQMQSLASSKKRAKLPIDDNNSFETEVQEANAACTKDKETVSDLKQHSCNNLPSSADNAAEQKPKSGNNERGGPTLEEIENLKGLQQTLKTY